MSTLGRRQWGYWNDNHMLPLEIQLASLQPVQLPRVKGPRGTSDKTGQATRQRIRERLLKIHGPYCHLCLLHTIDVIVNRASVAAMRTANATEARMRVVDQRMARRLRDRGWTVVPPMPVPALRDLGDDVDPCAGGCSNPAVHAEGGHDV